jgi:hypothetical protein
MKKHYDERSVLISLARNNVKVEFADKRIIIGNSQSIGIHTWGKIDFLVHYCGYIWLREPSIKVQALIAQDEKTTKAAKKEAKAEAKIIALKKSKKSNNNLIKSGVMKATKIMKKLINK